MIMKTLVLQIQNEEDYLLFYNFAKRLNCKIIPMDNWLESDKSDIEFTEEMKGELDKSLSDYEKNPNNVYSMEDVKLELEGKFGRKLQVKSRS